ncbi:RHS repeat-associated core domain-containing protein [Flavobacterium sp. PS2]|uniref:RHS repeat-associated core domain-containing protein n=1 Tax=Flavobacterium sp. PS2 TaxID=3384157 RepID=UPI00390CA923
MKKLYFTLAFLGFTLFTVAQTSTGNSTEVGITEGELAVSLSGGATYAIPIAVPPGINGVVPQISLVYNSQGGNGMAGNGWNISGVSSITRIPASKFHDDRVGAVSLNAQDRFALDGQRLVVKTGIYGANETVYETENFSNIKITSYGVHPNGANYGPAYFRIEYPDGSKASYGISTDSRSITEWSITYWENAQGVRINYIYVLTNNTLNIASIKYGSRTTEASINEIQFIYKPRKIHEESYVGGHKLLNNTILSEIKVFGNGVGYRQYKLEHPETSSIRYEQLERITEKSGDGLINYNPTIFTYDNTSNSIRYSSNPAALSLGAITSLNSATVSGDFDGDGNMDFLLYPTKTAEAKTKYWLFSGINPSQTNQTIYNFGVEHPIGNFEEIFAVSFLNQDYKLSPQQGWTVIKTDASTNVTKFSTYTTSLYTQITTPYEKQYTFPKFTYYNAHPMSCVQSRPKLEVKVDIPKNYISGDFNGDGLTDIVALEQNYYYTTQVCNGDRLMSYPDTREGTAYFVNLDRRLTSDFVVNAGKIPIAKGSIVQTGDFNGDGKTDIYVFNAGIVSVYGMDDKNKFVLLFKTTTTDINIMINMPILMGDYNGDGKTDFMIPRGVAYREWYRYSATGTGFNKETKTYPDSFQANDPYNSFNYITTDFDKDGKTDLVVVRSSSNSTTLGALAVKCYVQDDTNSFYPLEWIQQLIPNVDQYALPIYLPMVDSKKPKFEIAFINNNKLHFFDSSKDSGRDRLLKTITTGNGVKETISYQSLDPTYRTNYNQVYSSSMLTEKYPNFDIVASPNFQIVTQVEKESASVRKKKLFLYYGAVTNYEGQGFMGFRSTVRTNWHDDSQPIISSMSKFDIDLRSANTENYTVLGIASPLLLPTGTLTAKSIVKEGNYTVTDADNLIATQQIILKPDTTIKQGSTFTAKVNPEANASSNTPINYITKSIMTYESNLLANKVFKLQNINTKEYNGLENTNSETNTNYDVYDNPTKSTTILKEGNTVVQTNVQEVTYESSPTPYIVGRPKTKNQSITVTGDVMTSQEVYYYNGAQLLEKIEKTGTATNTITEANSYDIFGNVTKKTISAPGLAARVTDYQYDASGRFLTKVIDAERLETKFVNNPNNGTLENVTDAYGITTSYTYDKWFKKLTAKNEKLNKTVSYSYTKNEKETIFRTIGDLSDGSYTEEIMDDLGRTIKTGIKDVNGKMSYVSYLYDIYDRSYKVSEPYFGSSPTQWNETKFDSYGRAVEGILFTGRSTTTSYPGLTTTFNDGLKNKTAIRDAAGNILSVQENTGGIINYKYFANGNLKETSYNSTTIKMEQDGWGRKTKLIDPTAGTFVYENNDFGELRSETTQNGSIVTTIERDATGKPIKKTITGPFTNSETNYVYDQATKLPTVITFTDKLEAPGFNTIITTLTYDPDYKRVVTIVEDKVGYAKFTKTFTYDGLGRIDIETKKAEIGTKSSTVATKYKYQNGALYQILDNATSQVLWQTNALNAKGQILENTIGNGIKMTNEYDSNGYLKKIQHDKTTNPAGNIITLTTAFDKNTDNLDSRTNSTFGNWTESFKYDDLERLTEFTNSYGKQETQNYEVSGKIKDNNLGTYLYEESSKPYQNTAIDLTPEALKYYADRAIVFYDGMEDRTGWTTDAYDPQKITFTQSGCVGNSTLQLATSGPNITNTVTSDKIIQINNTIDTKYTFSARIYTTRPKAEVRLLQYENNETVPLKSEFLTTKNTIGCTYVTKTFIIPANIKQLRIRLDVLGTQMGTGEAFFDEITLHRADDVFRSKDPKLIVDYNAFKSPVKIEETGVDKINFTYNDDNQRSSMFYGSLDSDKASKPLRKHYATDGSMEIKENRVTGALEFITYVGGDGYSAPIIAKSDGTNTPNYLYLHRDYQGSIMAISDANGTVIEKRLYDAWGKISKVQDGAGNNLPGLTVLDRGYTGHEHLQSVGLINMNARLYDPMLHRFLSVDNYVQDPTNTQNYNQYGYVMNNPLKYTDPSGNKASGNGKDCVDCGLTPTEQTGIGNGIKFIVDNWDSWGIKDWVKEKISLKNLFGKKNRNRDSEPPPPPPNMSSYVNMNTSGNQSLHFTKYSVPINGNGLTVKQWENLPWLKRIFSDRPGTLGGNGILGFVSGGGGMKFVQYSGEGLKLLKSTELYNGAAQSEVAIAEIISKMKAGDPSIYIRPVYTYLHNGQRYILNGHHRITAAIRSGETIEAIELTGAKMYHQFGIKMEEIWAGLHF